MKAPFKAALLKALEQISEVADTTLAVATATAPPVLRPEQQLAVLVGGLKQVRTLARAARGDKRWGRRPSRVPLPPAEEV